MFQQLRKAALTRHVPKRTHVHPIDDLYRPTIIVFE
jgi:hypothetical protein